MRSPPLRGIRTAPVSAAYIKTRFLQIQTATTASNHSTIPLLYALRRPTSAILFLSSPRPSTRRNPDRPPTIMCNGFSTRTTLGGARTYLTHSYFTTSNTSAVAVLHPSPTAGLFTSCLLQFHNPADDLTQPTSLTYTLTTASSIPSDCEVRIQLRLSPPSTHPPTNNQQQPRRPNSWRRQRRKSTTHAARKAVVSGRTGTRQTSGSGCWRGRDYWADGEYGAGGRGDWGGDHWVELRGWDFLGLWSWIFWACGVGFSEPVELAFLGLWGWLLPVELGFLGLWSFGVFGVGGNCMCVFWSGKESTAEERIRSLGGAARNSGGCRGYA